MLRKRTQQLIYLSWVLVFTLALIQVFANTKILTDITSFMPSGNNDKQQQLLKEFQAGAASRLWLIAITGKANEVTDADALLITAQSQKLAVSLRESGLFSSIENGASAVDDKLAEGLFHYRYLLDRTINEDYFSVSELRHALLQRLEEMASPFSSFSKRLLVSDPTAAMLRVSESFQGRQSALELSNGVWYSRKENRALLIASSKGPGSNIDAQEKVYKFIQRAFEQSRTDEKSSLIVSGSPLFAVVARDSIRKESQRLSIAAVFFMLLFMFVVFKSGMLVLLTMLPLAGGLVMATALVSLLYGSIHGITLAFGITLLGVAIDYPVHLLIHAQKEKSLKKAAVRIWPVLRLGVLTTALGYGAMVWTDFTGLSQLGAFSLVGLITAALVTRYLLPVLKQKVNVRKFKIQRTVPSRTIRLWKRIVGMGLIGFLLVSLIGSNVFLPDDIWSRDIASLSPVSEKLLQQDRLLRARAGMSDVGSLIRIKGKDAEEVLRKEEQLRPALDRAVQESMLGSYLSAAEILPSVYTQQQRQSLLPVTDTLTRRLDQAMQNLPFRVGSFMPFLESIQESKSMHPLKPADLQGTSLGAALNGLLSIDSEGATGIIKLNGLLDVKAFQESILAAAISQVAFVNIKAETNELIDDFRQEMVFRIAWMSGVIVLVLLLGLKSVLKSVAVITPVILAVLFAALVPLWLGETLTLFHLVSLLLVAGLGLDYALFFSSIRYSMGNTKTVTYSLIICSISSFVVFSMLAFSSIPVLHAIGITVSSGVIAAFLFSWILSGEQSGELETSS